MSKIIMTPIQENAISAPSLGKCVIFFNANNNNELSVKASNGLVVKLMDVISDGSSTSLDKTYSIDKIKSLIQNAKNDILDGAGSAYDTLKEISSEIQKNDLDISSILTNMSTKVSFEVDQSKTVTSTQQQTARKNIDVYGKQEIGDINYNLVELFENRL